MSSNPVSVTGYGPFEFTDSNGKHVSIPLTALTVTGNKIWSSNPDWNTYLSGAPAYKLWQYLLAEGLLSPTPSPAPFPAMVIRAANAGAAGNTITVTIAVSTPPSSPAIEDPTLLPFTIQVSETNTYTNQTAATIASTLKTANAMVQVIESVLTTGTPQAVSGSFSGSPDQIAVLEDGSPGSTLFVLGPRVPGPNPLDVSVTISPTSASPPAANPETFTLTASWTSPSVIATVNELGTALNTASSQLGPEIAISKPSGGAFSLPQGGSTTLTGGTATSNASATLYTSLP
jgi:hypothetical protein